MFDVLSGQYKNLASKGRYGDTMLAHINPQEAGLLKSMGGAGTINPQTGLREFYYRAPKIETPSALQAQGINSEQVIPQSVIDALPKQLQTQTIQVPKGIQGGGFYEQTVVAPPANAIPITKVTQVGQDLARDTPTGEYYIPLDGIPNYPKTDALGNAIPPLVAKYDASGNLQSITAQTRYAVDENYRIQPEYNLKGQLVATGLVDNREGEGGGFGDFLQSAVKDFAPMIALGVGANYLLGSGLLSGAGAAGGAAGAGGAALSPYAAQAAGAYGGSTAAAAAAAAGSLTGIQAATAGQNVLTQAALNNTGLTFTGGEGLPTTPTTTVDGTTSTATVDGTASTATGSGSPLSGTTTRTATAVDITEPLINPNVPVIDPLATANISGGLTTAAVQAATTAELASATSILSKLGSAGSTILDFIKANPGISGSVLGAIVSAVGGADAPTSQTTTTSVDPDIKKEYLYNLQTAKEAAAGLNARTFQDFTPDYQLASQQVKDLGLGGLGQQTTNMAADLALFETGFTPQQIKAANAGSASKASATGYTAAQIAAAQANRVNVANALSGAGAQYMSAYQNPYEQQVVQGALGDIESSRLMQEQANMAKATAAKAFGGSRQGIVSGMTNEAALREAANTAAQLRSAGFTQAAQLGQTDAARALQAQLANQGIDVTLEQANVQLRQQGLLSNQAATNQALQFGAGATNQANLSNAAALNQMAQFNAQLQQQAALANQAAYAQGAGIRQGAIGQLGQLGAQQQNLGLSGANAVMEDQIRQQALAQARLDATRNLGVERLGITSGALGLQPANLGGTTSQPLYNSTAGNLLTGGLTGAYIGSLLGGKP
jgi:hypothetical protein